MQILRGVVNIYLKYIQQVRSTCFCIHLLIEAAYHYYGMFWLQYLIFKTVRQDYNLKQSKCIIYYEHVTLFLADGTYLYCIYQLSL